MSDEGQLVADRYRITRRIGTGAMGAVWQGHDELLGRVVAIKQLLLQPGLESAEAEEARQRTMREGRIAARLHHPNAITVFDAVTDEHGQPCLIMEYLESTSLATLIQDRGSVPPLEVARIGQQVASALKSAHQVGIVHRDIKPGNVLLTDDGVVKITDFGISKAKDDVSVTKTGLIAGTPAYLAPEVALGNEPGPESDVFSLGSTLYAASEGQPPFGLSENTLSLLHAVAAGQIYPPVQSGPLTSVLALLLHPAKEQRPDAERAEEVLAAVARGETPVGGPVTHESGVAAAGLAATGLAATGLAGADEDPADMLYDDAEPSSTSGTLTGVAADGPDATRVAPMAATGSEPGPEGSGTDTDAEHSRSGRGWKPLVASGLMVSLIVALTVWVFGDQDQSHGEAPAPPVTDDTTTPTTSAERTSTTSRERTTTEPEPEPTTRPARTTDTADPTDSTTTSRDTTTHPTSSETGGDGTGGEETGGDDGTDDGGDTGGDETGGGDTGGDDGTDDGGDTGGDETGGDDTGGDDGTDDGGDGGAAEGDQNTATTGRI
ncbi:Serine/threonine protein kinase [Haloechinothrix alba]|uniref:non-specific serine/threonine protein kinase n=1 Tax=Haloechinothrix alba TaxID=664784 RepID=A0A238VTD0_9PSEU|nr:serine/threonine-protein kinase [Haloechinothrix alba]SNR37498.1 Serine/threonine protein kinase [Haloechinothrix alba]